MKLGPAQARTKNRLGIVKARVRDRVTFTVFGFGLWFSRLELVVRFHFNSVHKPWVELGGAVVGTVAGNSQNFGFLGKEKIRK